LRGLRPRGIQRKRQQNTQYSAPSGTRYFSIHEVVLLIALARLQLATI
jgi:hypothetical protein